MAHAEQSAVSKMIEVIDFCENCPLGQEFGNGHVFATIAGPTASTKGTEIFFSDDNHAVGKIASGIRRPDEVISVLNNCTEPISKGRFIFKSLKCAALFELNKRRTNGREEIPAR